MADWYTGPGGAVGNGGTSWADRKDTITNLLAVAYAAGDRLLCGPGVYRETVTLNGSGSSIYSTGTVDVINESTALVGNGTNFLATPVLVGDQFFAGNLASGADGVTNGTATFTSATGNFQATMAGFMIEIITKGAYIIQAVGAVNSLTLADPNGIGWPAAGAGLDYYIVSGEGPYEITAVTDGTHLTIHKPWSGPSITLATGVRGVDYLIYRPVYLIGDVTGVETDGIGGVVRITGSDDDETLNRSECITGTNYNYWIIRGFYCSNGSYNLYFDNCDYITIEDCEIIDGVSAHIDFDDSIASTVRRCVMLGGYTSNAFDFTNSIAIDNGMCLGENLYCDCGDGGLAQRVGGCTFKNITMGFHNFYGFRAWNMQAGNGSYVRNCQIVYCRTAGVHATANGMLIENYNNFWDNSPDRTNVNGVGASSTASLYLPTLPRLLDGYEWPFLFFPPSEWESTREIANFYPKNEDIYGVVRPITDAKRSWGFTQWYAVERSTTLFYGTFSGSLYLPDAMDLKVIGACVEDTTYAITVQVYLEAGYAGNAPQMIIRQAGANDVTITSTGATGVWQQLSTAYTSGSTMDWFTVILRSRNTSVAPPYGVAWNNLTIN